MKPVGGIGVLCGEVAEHVRYPWLQEERAKLKAEEKGETDGKNAERGEGWVRREGGNAGARVPESKLVASDTPNTEGKRNEEDNGNHESHSQGKSKKAAAQALRITRFTGDRE